MNNQPLEWVKENKIIGIIRGIHGEAADRTAEALAEGGIRMLEVTLNTEGALETIARWQERFGDRLYIGAGTVLDVEMAKQAVQAGARYLISPNLDEDMIRYALSAGVGVFPGVMTPTEIVRAWKAGATAIKLFPMGTLGLKYLKEVRAPLNHIPIIPTGGVNLDNIGDFFAAGAVGVGLGNSLVDKHLIESGQFDKLRELARSFARKAGVSDGDR